MIYQKIGGTTKTINTVNQKIDGVSKQMNTVYQKIGGVAKTIYCKEKYLCAADWTKTFRSPITDVTVTSDDTHIYIKTTQTNPSSNSLNFSLQRRYDLAPFKYLNFCLFTGTYYKATIHVNLQLLDSNISTTPITIGDIHGFDRLTNIDIARFSDALMLLNITYAPINSSGSGLTSGKLHISEFKAHY